MSETSAYGGQESGSGHLRCSGVMISPNSISRLRRGKPVKTIPRERIIKLKLCRDTGVKRPFCHFLSGFTMVMLGVIGEFIILVSSLTGLRLDADTDPEGFVIPLIPVGFWVMLGTGLFLLVGVFRAKYHLLVETGHGITRIFFEKPAGRDEICQFLSKAGTEFGYEFDISETENPAID